MSLGTPSVVKPGNRGLLKSKTYNFLAQDEAQVARMLGQPQVSGYVTTGAAESGQIIDLTDELGASAFLADHTYQILLRARHSNDANRWCQSWAYNLRGGTTPVILGSGKLLKADGHISTTPVDYGRCMIAYPVVDGALGTVIAALTSKGWSLDGLDNGNGVITHPIVRATNGVRTLSAHFAADVETIGERRHVQVVSQSSATTSTLSMSTINGTEAVGVPSDDGELTVEMFALPPPSVFLSMNSNNVEVHVGYDASDLIQHYVDVFIGEGEYIPFGA